MRWRSLSGIHAKAMLVEYFRELSYYVAWYDGTGPVVGEGLWPLERHGE
jgi:hypothetical protein